MLASSRKMSGVVGLVLAGVLLGCGHVKVLPPVPGKGGPAWMELTSEHFVLWTDLPEPEARKALRHFEDFRQVMVERFFTGVEPAGKRSLVIAIRRWDEWRLFGSAQIAGFFQRADESLFEAPFLAFSAEGSYESEFRQQGQEVVKLVQSTNPTTTAQHELTHMLLDSIVPGVPPWFDEGLASYLATAKLDEEARTAEFGRLPENLMDRFRGTGFYRADDIVHSRGDVDRHSPGFYLMSHVVISYLVNAQPDRFAAYVRALQEVAPEERTSAWERVFGDYQAGRLQSEVGVWLRKGTVKVTSVRLAPKPSEPERERPLGDAEVYALRAVLFLAVGGSTKLAEALESLRGCVGSDATHVVCNVLLFSLDRTAPVHAEAVVKAHPEDWRAWVLLAAKLPDGDDRKAAQRHACELVGDENDHREKLCKDL